MENENTEQQNPEVQSEQSQTRPASSLPRPGLGRLNDKFKLPKIVFLGIAFVILLSIIGGAYFLGKNGSSKQIACTQEAKICPDGSAVGRSGPNCEFTQCPEAKTTSPSPSTSANTSSWKTYTNTKVGFVVKYPSDYPNPVLPSGAGPTKFATESEYDTDLIFGSSSSNSFSIILFPFKGSVIDLKTDPRTKNFPPYEWINSSKTKIFSEKNITVDNTPATWIEAGYSSQEPNDRISFPGIFFVKNNYAFIITSSYSYDRKKLSDVVSAFKFTNSTSSDTTADWKTYNSALCGVSVNYPDTWKADDYFFASSKDVCINVGDEDYKTGSGDVIFGFYINVEKRLFDSNKYESLESYVKSFEIEGIPFKYSQKNYGTYSGFEFDPPGVGDNRSFMFLKDGYVYEVNWRISTSGPYLNIISKIISSIKFTN